MRQKQSGKMKFRRGRFSKAAAMTLAAALALQNVSPAAAMVWQPLQREISAKTDNTGIGRASDSNAEKENNSSVSGGNNSNEWRATNSNAEKATVSNAEKAVSLNLIPNGDFEETQSVDEAVEETKKPILKDFWQDNIIPVGWTELWNAKDGVGNVTAKVEEGAGPDGSNAVHIKSIKNAARVDFSQKVQLAKALEKRYEFSFQIKADNVTVAGESTWKGFVVRVKTPNSSTKKEDEFKHVIQGTNDWETVSFEVTPHQGAMWVSCELFSEQMQGEVWIDNIQMVQLYDLSMNAEKLKMAPEDTFQLSLMRDTEEVTEGITWSSSNEAAATVDEQGLVTAHQVGNAVITAELDENNKVACMVAVEDAAVKAQYKKIRDEWRDRLTGGVLGDTTDPRYLKNVVKLTETAKEHLDSMISAPEDGKDDRTTLWKDIKLYDYPGYVTKDPKWTDVLDTTFSRVENMAKAYAAEGGGLYHDEKLKAAVIDALEWLYAKKYNETYEFTRLYGNWWTWYIGLPKKLSEILILMYGELPEELFEKEVRTLAHFNEDPTRHYGVDGVESSLDSANLADTCLIAVLRAAAAEDPLTMQMAADAFVTIFPYVESENGFYEDGSCIQHKNLAYTGAYGSVLLNGAERVLALLRGTMWEPVDENINNVFSWIMEGYFPLMADGGMMSMVSGRSVARPANSEVNAAKGVLRPMTMLSELAPEEIKTRMRETIKNQLQAVMRYDENYLDTLSLEGLRSVRELLADDTISGDKKELYHKNFGAMDKVTHHAEKFSLGISMYSNRISGYEIGNYENKKGWHQSDGVLYLYNGDQAQYSNDYWPTVDPHRLAGITTDHTEGSSMQWANYTSSKSWVGGTSILGRYGATGMDFEGEKTSLTANKSWFTFGDEVVALGADICSDEDKMTETIVENRKIRDDGSNKLIVDGTVLTENAAAMKMTWALLEGNESTSQNIGYYFPGTATVDVQKEVRVGNWKDINGNIKDGSEHDREIKKNYASLAISHGTMPAGASYSYVLLPGMTEAEVAGYAADPAVEILSNTGMVQAVRHKGLNVAGYNFWKSGTIDGITAKTPASVMTAGEGDQLTLSISNPRQNERDTVIEIAGIYELAESDDGVTVTQERNRTVVTVAGAKDFGKTYTVVLQDETGPLLKEYQKQAAALNIDSTKEAFDTLIADMEDTLANGNGLTDQQKEALEQLIEECREKQNAVQRVKAVLHKITAVSEVTLENADAADALLREFDALPDYEKSLLTAKQQDKIARVREMFYVDEITDEATGLTITALPGCNTLDLRTRVVMENRQELIAGYQERLAEGLQLNQVLDIRLMVHDTPMAIEDHPVRITMPADETLAGRPVAVVYFAKPKLRLADGDMVIPVIKEGRMSFTVGSDGYYYGIAVGKSDEDSGGDGGNGGSGGGSSNSSGSSAGGKSTGNASAGTWQKNAKGWWYQRTNHTWPKNQWELIRGLWYYFDEEGYMKTGWQMVNGRWYYLHDDGHMAANQWIQSNGDWYYLDANGGMMANAVTPDGYQVDADGVWR